MFAIVKRVFIFLFFCSNAFAFYPLHPMGNISALLGNNGLALYNSDSAPAYNPAALAGLKYNNFSVGTSFIGVTQMGSLGTKMTDRSESPSFDLSSGFLGTYFSVDEHKMGLFVFKKYNFKVNKYFVTSEAGTVGDMNLKMDLESDRIGGIYATKLNQAWSLGVTAHMDLNSARTDFASKYVNSGITTASYSQIESKVVVLGARLGVYYEYNPYHHYAFFLEPRGTQVSQTQTRSAVAVSTTGTVTDDSLRQDTDETTPGAWGLGYRYVHSDKFEYLIDMKITNGMTYQKSLTTTEFPDMGHFGFALMYHQNETRSFYYGVSSTNVTFAKEKESKEQENVSNTVTYLSAGVSQMIRYLKTSAGLYYSHYQTRQNNDAEPQTNIKSYGLIFSTSYDF